MTTPIAVDWLTIQNTIYTWLANTTGIDVSEEDQRAPQPSYPYVTINFLPGIAPRAVRDERRQKADGSVAIVGQRDFVASIQIHVNSNDPQIHARTRLDSAVASLETPGVDQLFESVGLAVREKGQPQDFDLVVGSEWISRSQVDIRFGVASVLENIPETTPGYFDKVEVSSRIDGFKTPGDPAPLDLDQVIFDPNA